MSLLTSPTTDKQQLKFLNKMQRFYHRRGSSCYVPVEKHIPPQINTKVPTEAISQLQQNMKEFMSKISATVSKFAILDHGKALQILRRHSFFSDVAVHISENLYEKIQELESEIAEKNKKIQFLTEEIKLIKYDQNEQKQQNDKISVKYNPSKSVVSNVYHHARGLNQQEFVKFYNKTCLSNPLTLIKVHQNNPKDYNNIKQPIDKLSRVLQNQVSLDQQIINQLLTKIKGQLQRRQCRNPCCLDKTLQQKPRANRAKQLLNVVSGKPFAEVYKNDKSQQYFKRYYKGHSFNINDVTSATRTRAEQMERLSNQYRKKLKGKRMTNHPSHRYSASFTNGDFSMKV